MLQIRQYRKEDDKAWNDYIHCHPQGTIFHLIDWKKVIEKTFGHKSHYLIAEKQYSGNQNQIAGVLPLFQIKSRLFGHSLISVPFAERGGLLANSYDIAQKILDKASSLATQKQAEYVEFRNSKPLEGLPTKELYYSFQKEISFNPDENLQAIPRKQRRMVRVGIKNELKANFGSEYLSAFYHLLATNFHRLGTPIFPFKLFQNFARQFKDQVSIMVVQDNQDNVIAGVMSFYYKNAVLPYYAGSLSEYRNLAPNDFMYWSLMEHGRELGYTMFDFGRSKVDTGSYKFKKHWGFEPKPLAYQYILNKINDIPNISPTNPKYQKRIEMWRKLPFWATKIIGPRFSKFLG